MCRVTTRIMFYRLLYNEEDLLRKYMDSTLNGILFCFVLYYKGPILLKYMNSNCGMER